MLAARDSSSRSGFTLVEMLVIAPVALLVITGFIALMVTMVGDVIASRNQNVMTYEIQSALDTIDQDVRLSTEFLATSGTMVSPQGENGATSAFMSTANDLILGTIATNKNPIDPTRGFIYYNTPFSCTDPTQVFKNRIFFNTVIYFEKGGSLWRRTYVPPASAANLCQLPWQVNTCAPGYLSTATQCQTNDSEVVKNLKNFNVDYYVNPQDASPIADGSAPTAQSIKVTIEGEQIAAGRTVNSSASTRSTKLSSKQINLSVPGSPVVSASNTVKNANFSWPGVPTATSYYVRYNINGGPWITASENTTQTSFSVPALSGQTVSIKVLARNTTGTSADVASNNASITIPSPPASPVVSGSPSGNTASFSWPAVSGATSYDVRYNINGGAWTTVSTSYALTTFSVEVLRGQTVNLKVRAQNAYGISADVASNNESVTIPLWYSCAFQNGWVDYGTPYAGCGYTKTNAGVIVLRGLVKNGTVPSTILNLPAGYRPTHQLIFQATINPNVNARIDVQTSGNVVLGTTSGTSGYLSLAGITFIPAGSSYSWNTLTPINGWTNYGAPYSPLQSTVDSNGRVHTQALLNRNAAALGSTMASMPAGTAPKKVHYFPARSSGGYNITGMRPVGEMMDRSIASSWHSIQLLHYRAAHTGWQSFGYVAGAPGAGQMGNGWTYYNDSGSIHEEPQFTKGADGMVTVKGMIKLGTTTQWTTIANLPVGYRPADQEIFHVTTSWGFGMVDIGSSGNIVIRGNISNGWTSLDGIHFMTD